MSSNDENKGTPNLFLERDSFIEGVKDNLSNKISYKTLRNKVSIHLPENICRLTYETMYENKPLFGNKKKTDLSPKRLSPKRTIKKPLKLLVKHLLSPCA